MQLVHSMQFNAMHQRPCPSAASATDVPSIATPGEGGAQQSAATLVCRLPMQASSCGRNSGPPSSVAMSSCRSTRVAAEALMATLLSAMATLRSNIVLPCAFSGMPFAWCAMGCAGCAGTSPATPYAHSRLAAEYAFRQTTDTCTAIIWLHAIASAMALLTN